LELEALLQLLSGAGAEEAAAAQDGAGMMGAAARALLRQLVHREAVALHAAHDTDRSGGIDRAELERAVEIDDALARRGGSEAREGSSFAAAARTASAVLHQALERGVLNDGHAAAVARQGMRAELNLSETIRVLALHSLRHLPAHDAADEL
jgi:hypothetical protein